MTLHINYDYKCTKWGEFYVPYKKAIPSPKCVNITDEYIDIIKKAVNSINYNLERYRTDLPGAWWIVAMVILF